MRNVEMKKVSPLFVERWSPRSFLVDPISGEDVNTLFEAARWAPSCYNEQPWLFVYAKKKDDLKRFQSVLVDVNKAWADKAPMLVIVFAKRRFAQNNSPNRWARFDAGSAFMSLTLQAQMLGLSCHAMGGFDEPKAYEVAGVDKDKYEAMCVVALGYQGPKEQLPETIQSREAPSDRKPLAKVFREVGSETR